MWCSLTSPFSPAQVSVSASLSTVFPREVQVVPNVRQFLAIRPPADRIGALQAYPTVRTACRMTTYMNNDYVTASLNLTSEEMVNTIKN